MNNEQLAGDCGFWPPILSHGGYTTEGFWRLSMVKVHSTGTSAVLGRP